MKNLKMFAIAVMAFAVMAMGVSAACTDTSKVQGEKDCYTNLVDAITTGLNNDDTKFTLLDNAAISNGTDLEITKNVTIDLGANNITFGGTSNGIKVLGGNLTLKGTGKIESASGATASLIEVSGGHNLTVNGLQLIYRASTRSTIPAIKVTGDTSGTEAFTKVTFDSNVKVTSDGYGLVVDGASTTGAPRVEVNMAGTWTTKNVNGYVVKVNGTVGYIANNAPVINIASGTYTAEKATALYASGYATWNISGGDITGAQALEVRSGVVNITGGNLKADGDYHAITSLPTSSPNAIQNGAAINVVDGGSNYVSPQRITVNVSGGTVTSENGYAMYLKNLGEYGTIGISGNTKFTSANDNRGQLAAIQISEDTTRNYDDVEAFLAHHKNMVKGGTFTGDVFEKINTSANTIATSADLAKELVEGEVNITDGNATVDDNKGEEPGQQPGSTEPGNTGDGNQGGTDNVKNPETNDNILVYAGLGLVSLTSVAFTARKRED